MFLASQITATTIDLSAGGIQLIDNPIRTAVAMAEEPSDKQDMDGEDECRHLHSGIVDASLHHKQY